jgi:hypothetical protein
MLVMSQYAVLWNEKTRTFTIKDEDPGKPNEKAHTHIYMGKVGEITDASGHPQPSQHLDNQAHALGVEFRYVTIKNDSSNILLDDLEKEGEEYVESDHVTVVSIEGDAGNDGGDRDKAKAKDTKS